MKNFLVLLALVAALFTFPGAAFGDDPTPFQEAMKEHVDSATTGTTSARQATVEKQDAAGDAGDAAVIQMTAMAMGAYNLDIASQGNDKFGLGEAYQEAGDEKFDEAEAFYDQAMWSHAAGHVAWGTGSYGAAVVLWANVYSNCQSAGTRYAQANPHYDNAKTNFEEAEALYYSAIIY